MSEQRHSAEKDAAPVHLLIVLRGEHLRDHRTACGLKGMEVPISHGLTQNPLLFTCVSCGEDAPTRILPPADPTPPTEDRA